MLLSTIGTWLSSPRQVEAESHNLLAVASEHATQPGTAYSDENAVTIKQNLFQLQVEEVKHKPRAWQRRPATPFAHRAQSQKIWKRVPLQNLAASVNNTWERGGHAGDGIMRPAKKVRVKNAGGGQLPSIIKCDEQLSPMKTPSRRKPALRADVLTPVPIFKDEILDGQSQGDSVSQPGSSDEEAAEDDLPSSSPFLNGTVNESTSPSSPMAREVTAQITSPEPPSNGHKRDQALLQIPHNSEGPATCHNDSGVDQCDGSSRAPGANLAACDDEHEARGSDMSLVNSSEPTTEPGSPMMDFDICSKQSDVDAINTPTSVSKDSTASVQDHDDTTYLEAFLSRNRAQKEARTEATRSFSPVNLKIALIPSELQLASQSTEIETSSYTVPSSESLSLPENAEDRFADTEAQAETDALTGSPSRRSTRTKRLPWLQRPIALPNTISLRRLNGSEFIAMQKESQSLAIATRSNTKRNKGTALNVKQRLVQLQAEKHQAIDDDKSKSGRSIRWSEMLARVRSDDGAEIPYMSEPKTELPNIASEPEEDQDTPPTVVEDDLTLSLPRALRKRKQSLGNVNGTPAPKKSIDIMLENASQANKVLNEAQPSNPTPIKRSRTRSRS